MSTYRVPIIHRAGSRFDFECEASSPADARRIAEDFHPGSRVGAPALVPGTLDDHSASRRVDVLEAEAPHLLAREDDSDA